MEHPLQKWEPNSELAKADRESLRDRVLLLQPLNDGKNRKKEPRKGEETPGQSWNRRRTEISGISGRESREA